VCDFVTSEKCPKTVIWTWRTHFVPNHFVTYGSWGYLHTTQPVIIMRWLNYCLGPFLDTKLSWTQMYPCIHNFQLFSFYIYQSSKIAQFDTTCGYLDQIWCYLGMFLIHLCPCDFYRLQLLNWQQLIALLINDSNFFANI
jgi:hypothetical protein